MGFCMSFHILGLGTALPRHSVPQTTAMELAKEFSTQTDDQRRLLPVLYRRTGVKRRHSVLLEAAQEAVLSDGESAAELKQHVKGSDAAALTMLASTDPLAEVNLSQSFYPPAIDADDGGPTTSQRMECYGRHAGELATQAARNALEQAELAPSKIKHLVTVSCTGFHAPGVDLELIRELGLMATTSRSHIGFMGCHGALNGLRLARAYADSDPGAHVLMVAVELCSLHHQYGWHPDRIVANALFADGAAAIVGRGYATDPEKDTSDTHAHWKVAANGSLVLPRSEDAMTWRIRNHGFQMTLSATVPDMIRQSLKPWVSQWLQSNGLPLEEIGSWAIHPGGPRILSACEEALELDPMLLNPSREILSRYGNMSSPTVLFIVNELMRTNAPLPCEALAFGPGLAI
jgi:prepilin-type processing-associated H-X9-DG protein